jgi:holliday junction DNA helicase RuvB
MSRIQETEMTMPNAATEISAAAPTTLDHVLGQRQAVEQLRVALAAFWNDRAAGRNPTFGPVLMAGPPGCGKTLIAKIIAAELGGSLKETLGQSLGAGAGVYTALLECCDDTVLFVDEAAHLDVVAQHAMLRALEDRVLLLPHGRSAARNTAIPLSGFTTLLATTNPEGLISPLRDRMKIVLRFRHYDQSELAELCGQRAQALRWTVEQPVLWLAARCAKQTPRLALRLLEAAYRVSRSEDRDVITVAHFLRTLELEGLEQRLGLDALEQAYLRHLSVVDGRPLRLNMIAAKLGLPPRTVSEVTEAFLVRQGLVTRSDAGRELTREGWDFVRGVVRVE